MNAPATTTPAVETPPKPTYKADVQLLRATVPPALRSEPRFVLWRYEWINGRWDKRPRQRDGRLAKTNDRYHWMDCETAIVALHRHPEKFAGVGFVLGPDLNGGADFAGLDLDYVLDDEQLPHPYAQDLVAGLPQTYAEISPSGRGIKIIGRVARGTEFPWTKITKPEGHRIERYVTQYFTMTGRVWNEHPGELLDITDYLVSLNGEKPAKQSKPSKPTRRPTTNGVKIGFQGTDDELIDWLIRHNEKFPRLWAGDASGYSNDASAADAALCGIFAWATAADAERIDRLMRDSGLYREKWERTDYRERTITGAIAACGGKFFQSTFQPRVNGTATNGTHRQEGTVDAAATAPAEDTSDASTSTQKEEPTADTDEAGDPEQAKAATDASTATAATSATLGRAAMFAGPPVPLGDPTALDCSGDVLPGVFGEMVRAVAAESETPLALATTFGLGAIAAATQGTFVLRVNSGYREPLALFAACALPPGTRKTSVMNRLLKPIFAWEREQGERLKLEIIAAQSKQLTLKERINAMRARAAKADSMQAHAIGNEIQQLEEELAALAPPTVPQRVAQDVTVEHLATLMARQGERMAIMSDEAGVMETIAGRYNRGIPNLDLILQAYSASFVRVQRGSKPEVVMSHPTLSLVLSPQPDVIKGMASKPGFSGRGLLDRFLYLMPQHKLGYRTLAAAPADPHVVDEYARELRNLLDIDQVQGINGVEPYELRLTSDALALWQQFQAEIETSLRPDGALTDMLGWGAKLPGNVLRVAGLLHLAKETFRAVHSVAVEGETMERAIVLGRLLIDHAKAAFATMGADASHAAARRLWQVIEKTRKPIFSARDAWHPLRGTFTRMSDLDGAFDVLIDHSVIAEPGADAQRKRGRPSRLFVVHPAIAEGWSK